MIIWADVLGLAPELSTFDESGQEVILAYVNEILDEDTWGGGDSPDLKMGRIALAAHFATLAKQQQGTATAGPVTSQSADGLSRSYGLATTVVGGDPRYDSTKYGAMYLTLVANLGLCGTWLL